MSLNVPDSNEEVHDKNIGAVSVPFNGVPKVKKRQILKNEEYNEWCCRYWKSRNSVWRMIWSVRFLKWELDGEYETKSFQDYNDGEFVCINIRGKKFIVLRENFERFPDTRLGKLVVKCCNFQLMVLVVRSGVEQLSRGWGTATDTLRETHRNTSSTCTLTVINGSFFLPKNDGWCRTCQLLL